jgi:heat shock protein HtpX
MWELIRSNRRKSFLLFILMGCALVLLGYIIGKAYIPDGGEYVGMFFAIMLWTILSILSYFSGSKILLSLSKAKEVTPDVHQQLYNVVEEMKIAAGLPKMPKIYIIDEAAPNAFATGIKPENSAITVTAGLLSRLNRDELQGVIGHEMSHIVNRDILLMTFAGIMLGSIVLISQVFLRSLWFTGGSAGRYRSRSRDSGQGQMIMMVVAIVLAILAPIFAQLLYFAISRRREYLADASSARLTRYPEGLASALEKISHSTDDLSVANKVTAPMYIVNPLKRKEMKLSDLTSTHPPISERIRILRNMSGGAALANYQTAYSIVKGRASNLIPKSGLADRSKIDIRSAGTAQQEMTKTSQKRTLGNLMMMVNNYLFLTCVCGIKIKIPPHYNKPTVVCPRCGHVNKIPVQNETT